MSIVIHLILIGACCFLITLAGVSITLFSDRDAKDHWDIRETYAGMALSLIFPIVYIVINAGDMGIGDELTNPVALKLIAVFIITGGAIFGAVRAGIWINLTWTLRELGMTRAEWDALGDDDRDAKDKSKKDSGGERRD